TSFAVRTSWLPNSGCSWISRRHSTIFGCNAFNVAAASAATTFAGATAVDRTAAIEIGSRKRRFIGDTRQAMPTMLTRHGDSTLQRAHACGGIARSGGRIQGEDRVDARQLVL